MSMKPLLIAVTLASLFPAPGGADQPKTTPGKGEPARQEKPAVSLRVGDPAPALKASRWLQGQPVRAFEPGKVYVVEFWATWCGWCILMMPHAAELQAQYKDQGVTFLHYSARDPDNTAEQVAAFVKRRGPRLPFAFADADDRTTFDAWVTAAGRKGLPCTFVVDRAGRIAFIGHPMYLGVALPKVLAADATPQAVGDAMRKVWEDFHAIGSVEVLGDDRASLKAIMDFEAKYPAMANLPPLIRAKLSYMPKVGAVDEARRLAEAMVARAIKQGDPASLDQVSSLLRLGAGKRSKELLAVAVKAAEAMVRLTGDEDASALLHLASTYAVAGDRPRAREYARKAVAAAAGSPEPLRRHIEEQARAIEDEKQDGKK
jgi:thiol-disulfide isomerase/thioredoxin